MKKIDADGEAVGKNVSRESDEIRDSTESLFCSSCGLSQRISEIYEILFKFIDIRYVFTPMTIVKRLVND